MQYLLIQPVGVIAIFAIAGLMLRSWLSHKERMKGLSISRDSVGPSDQRLARLEQAVESIAIEVERISEGQRYLTRVLAESHPSVQSPARLQRVDTPH